VPYYNFFGEDHSEEMAEYLGEDYEPPEPDEATDDDGGEGEYRYEAAGAWFNPEGLGEQARFVYDALRAAGVTVFHVRYDGGCDEGFAHPDAVVIDGKSQPIATLVKRLADGGFLESAAASGMQVNSYYAKKGKAEQVVSLIDELAYELASNLLGHGYGTGEYTLYGALKADLQSGEITDDPDATPPEHMQ
jgi:hypothetical protein